MWSKYHFLLRDLVRIDLLEVALLKLVSFTFASSYFSMSFFLFLFMAFVASPSIKSKMSSDEELSEFSWFSFDVSALALERLVLFCFGSILIGRRGDSELLFSLCFLFGTIGEIHFLSLRLIACENFGAILSLKLSPAPGSNHRVEYFWSVGGSLKPERLFFVALNYRAILFEIRSISFWSLFS